MYYSLTVTALYFWGALSDERLAWVLVYSVGVDPTENTVS
jgi:hypothetical protein